MVLTNGAMMFTWATAARLIFRKHALILDPESDVCEAELMPAVLMALCFSFAETFNAAFGITNSKPAFTLLFSVVRFGVEVLAAPLLPSCSAWQHILTVASWAVGDMIRFGCFLLDTLVPGGRVAKRIRYSVGPILFPIGAAGETLMIIAAASDGRPWMYVLVPLWGGGFYPLFKQLLRQRRKFFASLSADKKKEVKAV